MPILCGLKTKLNKFRSLPSANQFESAAQHVEQFIKNPGDHGTKLISKMYAVYKEMMDRKAYPYVKLRNYFYHEWNSIETPSNRQIVLDEFLEYYDKCETVARSPPEPDYAEYEEIRKYDFVYLFFNCFYLDSYNLNLFLLIF